MIVSGRRDGGGSALSVLPRAATDGDISKSAAFSPVPPAIFAEVARLSEVVVVIITEFCVCGFTPWALQLFTFCELWLCIWLCHLCFDL